MSRPDRRLGRLFPLVGAVIAAVLAAGGVARADPTPAQIDAEIRSESARLEGVVEQYNLVTEQLTATRSQVEAATLTIQPTIAELEQATDLVQRLAVRAYQGGALAQLSSVLASEDPGGMVDRMLALDQVSRVEQDRIDAARAAKARYDTEAGALTALIEEQSAQQASLDAQKQEIDGRLAELYELRRRAYGSAQTTGSRYTGEVPAVAGAAGVAVSYAYSAIGTPYVWAAAGPNGYDCSGLTKAAWAAAGVGLPHNTVMQWNALPHISRGDLAPGDLVFYSALNHVGLYVGNGQIIHAPTFGDHVRLASLDVMPPYGFARPG